MTTVATVIDHYGEAYWPVFEALEAELKARRERAKRIARFSGRRHSQQTNSHHPAPANDQHNKPDNRHQTMPGKLQ